jgi:hypothetical protein
MSLMNVTAKFLKHYTTISVIELCYFRSIIMTLGGLFHSFYSGFTVLDIPKSSKSANGYFLRSLSLDFSLLLSSLLAFSYDYRLSTAIVLFFHTTNLCLCG